MRAVLSTLILAALASPAMAFDIPEPGTVALVVLGIGAALWIGRGKKK